MQSCMTMTEKEHGLYTKPTYRSIHMGSHGHPYTGLHVGPRAMERKEHRFSHEHAVTKIARNVPLWPR